MFQIRVMKFVSEWFLSPGFQLNQDKCLRHSHRGHLWTGITKVWLWIEGYSIVLMLSVLKWGQFFQIRNVRQSGWWETRSLVSVSNIKPYTEDEEEVKLLLSLNLLSLWTQWNNSVHSKVRMPALEPWLCYLITVWPWWAFSTSLCSTFFPKLGY